uniref:Uncharacterized protein n=1 Tax=Lepeophtheirus salmonis TaxID=72036 RepID=A0A0K2UT08_LEPSM
MKICANLLNEIYHKFVRKFEPLESMANTIGNSLCGLLKIKKLHLCTKFLQEFIFFYNKLNLKFI